MYVCGTVMIPQDVLDMFAVCPSDGIVAFSTYCTFFRVRDKLEEGLLEC